MTITGTTTATGIGTAGGVKKYISPAIAPCNWTAREISKPEKLGHALADHYAIQARKGVKRVKTTGISSACWRMCGPNG